MSLHPPYSGLTWDHPRGYDALAAAAMLKQGATGPVINWARQPLEGFESHPIGDLLARYDLVVLDHPHIGEALAGDGLLPLDAVFDAAEIAGWRKQSVGHSMASYDWEGRSFALPLDVAAQVMASDPSRIAQAPDSWQELPALAERLPVALSIAGPHALLTWFSLCLSLGAEPGGAELIDQAAGREALTIMAALHRQRPARSETLNPIGLIEALAAGDIALLPLVFGYITYAKSVRFTNAPRALPGGRRGSVLGGTGIGLSRRIAADDALKTHLRWLMQADVQGDFIPEYNGQPSARSAWTSPTVNSDAGDFYRQTLETIESAWVRPRFDGYIAFQTAAAQTIRSGLADGAAADAIIDQLRALWQPAFARANASIPRV